MANAGTFTDVSFVFVVPAEVRRIVARDSQRGAARRGFRPLPAAAGPRMRQPALAASPTFLIERQLMQHVRQRLGMHQPMFDRDVQQECRRSSRPSADSRAPRQASREPIPIALDLRPRGPIRGLIRRQAAIHRIDAEREQSIELRIEDLHVRDARAKKIPIERFQMPDVENDPMPLGDGALVQRIRPDQIEELIRLPASFRDAVQERLANSRHLQMSQASMPPIRRSGLKFSQHGRNQLGDRWMNMHGALNHCIGALAYITSRMRVDRLIAAGSENRRAQNLLRVRHPPEFS